MLGRGKVEVTYLAEPRGSLGETIGERNGTTPGSDRLGQWHPVDRIEGTGRNEGNAIQFSWWNLLLLVPL